MRDAYARAQARPRKKLALVHKNNVLVHAGHLWTDIFNKVGEEFPRSPPSTCMWTPRRSISSRNPSGST